MLQRWDHGADRIPDLQVYGPTPIARMTEQLFGADGIDGPDISAPVGFAQHAQPYLECLAFRLDTKDGSLCYAGDSGAIADSIVRLAKHCDLLILMSHYFSGTEPSVAFRSAGFLRRYARNALQPDGGRGCP